MIKKLLSTPKSVLSFLFLFYISAAVGQVEPINMGQTWASSEYMEVLNEFSPKNHPGSGTKEQIVWKSGDNIYIYGNENTNFDYGTSAFWAYNMTIKQWKCIQPKNVDANYGTKNVFSATNSPGTRVKSTTFTDTSGNLYLFGGSSSNDLWKYDITLGQWAWIGGYDTDAGGAGNSGPLGVESPLYFPSARRGAKPTIGSDGKIYIYGGDAANTIGYPRSDLWRYNPANNEWARIYNNVIANSDEGQNIVEVGVENANNHPGRLFDYTSWFYNNCLYYFGGTFTGDSGTDDYINQVWKFNLATQQWACVKNSSSIDAIYGQQQVSDPANTPPRLSQLSTGVAINDEAYFLGGLEHGGSTVDDTRGLHNSLWKYNMSTNEWTWMTGNTKTYHPGFYGKKGVERTENMPAGRTSSFLWVDNGVINMYGGKTYRGNTIEFWKYNPLNNNFTWTDGKSRSFQKNVFSESDDFIDDASTPSVYNKLACSETQWGKKGEKLWVLLNGTGMWEYDVATSTNYLLIADPTGAGNYGQLGVAAANNIPPFRTGALLWETESKLYLMSGKKTSVYFNDFWSFDKVSKMWTWIGGVQNNATPYFQYGAIGEVNSANYPKSRYKGQTWVDADENLYMFSGINAQLFYMNDFWKYDTTADVWVLMGGSANNVAYTATYFTNDYPPFVIEAACWNSGDNLYLYGGTGIARQQNTTNLSSGTLSDVWKYSIGSNIWTKVNGNRKKDNPTNYGILHYGFSSNLPGARTRPICWSDDFGNLWMYGGYGKGEPGTIEAYLFDLWKFDISINNWIWMDGPKNPKYGYDEALDAYDWELPVVMSADCPVFKGNGKFYMYIRETRSSLWEVDIESYPGNYNAIEGYARFDSNGDCDPADIPVANLKLEINNVDAQFYTNFSGFYKIYTPELNNTLTNQGLVQNSSFFNFAPAAHTVNFTGYNNVEARDFCLSLNGIINDIEVTIIPLNVARPGNDANYKIIYKNKGNTTLSGAVEFNFDDSVQEYISATVTPSVASGGQLSWSYTDLVPFEFRIVEVTLNNNTPTQTPPVSAGDVLIVSAVINPVTADGMAADNTFVLSQGVVNSFDPNDKTCLQGATITEELVGEYLTYLIRFENTGNAAAQNITVTDMIDASRFDIGSIEVVDSSHSYNMTVTEDTRVDFIFQNINLPFANETNDGYIAFRIKTLPGLVGGNTISNTADIYFDYNSAITTNTYVITIEDELNTSDFENDDLIVYPNPVKNHLYFDGNTVTKISIYDISGRLLSSQNIIGNQADLSSFPTGIYLIKALAGEVLKTFKILKE